MWPMVISLGPRTWFDEPGGAFPLLFAQHPCLAACPSWAVGVVCPGSLLPLRRRPVWVVSIGGGCEFSHCSRDARTTLGGFGRLAVELVLYVRALRPGANGRPPLLPPNLDTTRVVICTVSCLNGRLPLAERAVVRSDPGSGLALDRSALSGGRARRCPKLQKTCVLLVWMRSVDDWPLARIRTRFPGVSRGR